MEAAFWGWVTSKLVSPTPIHNGSGSSCDGTLRRYRTSHPTLLICVCDGRPRRRHHQCRRCRTGQITHLQRHDWAYGNRFFVGNFFSFYDEHDCRVRENYIDELVGGKYSFTFLTLDNEAHWRGDVLSSLEISLLIRIFSITFLVAFNKKNAI